jgi:magnesium transporter
MLKAFIERADGTVSRDASPESLLAAMRDPKALFWVDMLKPTEEELFLLDEIFGFHPLAIEDTINYMQRPKIESYDHIGTGCTEGYFYMVFHGPDLASFRDNVRTKELDMFVSARYLVTVHDEEHKAINAILARAEADPRRVLDPGIDMLLHNILDHLTDNYDPILDYLQEALDDLEDRALNEPTQGLLQEISMKKRELLNLRRIVGPQREVLAQLTRGEVPFIRPATRTYLRDVQDHLIRTVEMVELYRDLALGARDIYLSSVSNNLNRIMKALTVITVTALPFTIITSFYGMNFDVDKIGGFWGWMLTTPQGFWLSMGVILAMVGVLIFFFRKYKWI